MAGVPGTTCAFRRCGPGRIAQSLIRAITIEAIRQAIRITIEYVQLRGIGAAS